MSREFCARCLNFTVESNLCGNCGYIPSVESPILNEFFKRLKTEEKEAKDDEAKTYGDKIGVDWEKYPIEAFRKGFKVEKEHMKTVESDLETVAKIALDHIKEMPDYYEKLDKVEKGLCEEVEFSNTPKPFFIKATGDNRYGDGSPMWLRIRGIKNVGEGKWVAKVKVKKENRFINLSEDGNDNFALRNHKKYGVTLKQLVKNLKAEEATKPKKAYADWELEPENEAIILYDKEKNVLDRIDLYAVIDDYLSTTPNFRKYLDNEFVFDWAEEEAVIIGDDGKAIDRLSLSQLAQDYLETKYKNA